jgi:hypothetical protein
VDEGARALPELGVVDAASQAVLARFRKQFLREQRELLLARMAEMQKTLELLNHKISVYESTLVKKERELALLED